MTIEEGTRSWGNQGEVEGTKTMLQKILLKLKGLDARLETIECRSQIRVGKGASGGMVGRESTEKGVKYEDAMVMPLDPFKTSLPLIQLKRLREEDNFFTYVDSFVSLVNQVELSKDDQVTMFIKGLKGDKKMIKILNPNNLQRAIDFARALTPKEDTYKNKERTNDQMVGLAQPVTGSSAKQSGSEGSQSKPWQNMNKGSTAGRFPAVMAGKNYVYQLPHRRSTSTEFNEKRVLQREAKEAQMLNVEQEKMLQNLECKETEHLRLQRCKVGMAYFPQFRVTVNGAFGEVRLRCAKDIGEIFAMKKLKKSEMLTRGLVEHATSEKNLLVEVNSRCIVQFNYSFQDSEFLYPIMAYLPREDIMTPLIREDIQSEDVVRLYNAERILAIHSIHQFDGIEASNKIKILVSANCIDTLDQVLLRPGQLDRKLEFPIPKEEFRPCVLNIHSRLTKLVRGIVWAMQGKGFEALYGYSPPIHILYIHRTTINLEVETILGKRNCTVEKLFDEEEKDVRGSIKRDTFEQISAPILESVKKPLEEALVETSFAVEKMHSGEVVSSGSLALAMVKILAEFSGREPLHIMNASNCVARECVVLSPTFKVHKLPIKEGFPFSVSISWKVTASEAEDRGVGNRQSTAGFPKGNPIPSVKSLTFYIPGIFSVDVQYANDADLSGSAKISTYTIGFFHRKALGFPNLRRMISFIPVNVASVDCSAMCYTPRDQLELKQNPLSVVDFMEAYHISRLRVVPSLVRVVLSSLQSQSYRRIPNSLQLQVLSGGVFSLSLWKMHSSLPISTAILCLLRKMKVIVEKYMLVASVFLSDTYLKFLATLLYHPHPWG